MIIRICSLICLLSIWGCNQNEYPHAFPIPFTLEVSNISSSGVQLNGRIETLGTGNEIENYGFVWGNKESPTLDDSHAIISEIIKTGVYSKLITSDLIENKVYYVRAFVKTNQQIIYGNVVSFQSLGSLPPQIISFSPSECLDGVVFSIIGKNFSTSPTGNIVKINNIKLDVLSANDSVLLVKLVPNPLIGSHFISVEVAEKQTISSEEFKVLGPRITSISKNFGRVGELLIAEGEYFTTAELRQVYGTITRVLSDNQFEFYVNPHQNDVPLSVKVELRSYQLGQNPNLTSKVFQFPEDFTIINSWNKIESQNIEASPGYSSELIDNEIFCVGGNSLVVYNTISNTWLTKSNFPGAYRINGVSFVNNNKLYYGFGEAGYDGPYYNDIWEYDPSLDSWNLIGNAPLSSRSKPEALVIGDKVYIGFGYDIRNQPNYFQDLWEFDIINNIWIERSVPFQNFKEIRTSFTIADKGYFIDGGNGDLWEFDPLLNTWQKKARFPRIPGYEPALTSSTSAFLISNDQGYGANYGKETHIYQYDYQNDFWRQRQILRRQDYAGLYRFSQYVNGKIIYAKNDIWELTFE